MQASVQEDRVIRLKPAPGPLNNPLKGWCPYTDAGPIHQPYSMVYQYVSWRELEPRPGEYRFAEWENRTWNVPEARDRRILFRVYLDYPGEPKGIPDWLKVRTTAYTDHGGGRSPHYEDPGLLTALERLIAALGQRYDRNPRVAFFPAGLLGFWGEWHTWPREELFARPATQQRVLEAVHRAFPNKMVMTRYPAGYAGRQPWMGFFDDMFPEDTDGPEDWKFLTMMRQAGRTENWKRAVIGGEMVPNAAKKWLGDGFERTLRMIEASHFSWVGPYCPALEKSPNAEFEKRSQQVVRRLGYTFQLNEVRHPRAVRAGDRLTVSVTGANTGVAPFYYPWPVEIALLDRDRRVAASLRATVDIQKWQPGPFRFTAEGAVSVKPGVYTLAFGIRDPWTGKPGVGLANALPTHEGWSVLSEISVAAG